jgi:hypothetical protein
MKNILYLLSLICMVIFMAGCEDEDRIRIPEFQTAANMRIVMDPQHSVINSTSVATDYIAFNAYSENKDLSMVELFLHYKTQRHLIGTYDQGDFASGQIRVELDGEDLASYFGVPGFADGSRGGNFTIRPRVTLNDGRVYPGFIHFSPTDSVSNLGTGITGNNATGAFTIQTGTAILCPPVDISGTYVVVSAEGTSTDPGVDPPFRSISGATITISAVPNSTTRFDVSDVTGGIYFDWYDGVYEEVTGPEVSSGRFLFNCNEVTIVETVELFGASVQGEGLYEAATGTITYNYLNGWGDAANIVLRKQ